MPEITVVAISDTHNTLHKIIDKIPEGDILIHAGDMTGLGTVPEVVEALRQISSLPHRDKIVISGNHDLLFDKSPNISKALLLTHPGITYLQDNLKIIQGIRIYGSPWTPSFCGWGFMCDRGPSIQKKWDMIPENLDILITHGPPHGHLDISEYTCTNVGCKNLRDTVYRVKPKFHVFGHIHGAHGIKKTEDTTYINAAICDQSYDPTQSPMVFKVNIRV